MSQRPVRQTEGSMSQGLSGRGGKASHESFWQKDGKVCQSISQRPFWQKEVNTCLGAFPAKGG